MSMLLRRRALPIGAVVAISAAALVLFIRDVSAQEATTSAPETPGAAQTPPPANPPPSPAATTATPPPDAATTQAPSATATGEVKPKSPELPEVKIIQEKAVPKPVEEAAPKLKKKPAPVIEVYEPAPAPKPKKKVAKAAAGPQPAAKPQPVQAEAAAPTPSSPLTALGTYNPALDLDGLELPPGTTITTAGPVNGYQALSAMSSTKTATPIERIPQSIQVVPRSVLTDQNALTVEEALRNVSGVQATSALLTPTQDATTIRGFAAEQWLDGLPVFYNPGNRDALANVERIEVLKGPSAILYGGGAGAPVGGAVNVVSKLPTDVAGGSVGVTAGSNRYVHPWFDINQPISADGTVLFRVTGEYTASDSFIDVIETDRYSINPTLTLTNKTDTTLTIQGRATKWEQQEYQGLPAVGTVEGGFRISRDLFIGPADIPPSSSQVQGVTVTFDHKFNEAVSTNVKARWSRSDFDELAQTIVGFGSDGFQANIPSPLLGPSTWALANSFLAQEQEEFTINSNVQVKFDVGGMRNVLLVGGDYSRVTDGGILTADFVAGGFGSVDLANPSFPFPYVIPTPTPGLNVFADTDNVLTTKGVYAQLQTTLYDRVHLLSGLRLANIEIESRDAAQFLDQTADETKLLPRGGIIVDVFSGLSVFASYSEGIRGVPGVLFAGAAKPEESDQVEGGVKFNTANGLSGTLAVFEINRTNTPVPVGGLTAAQGEERSQGFEADLLWQPDRNWQVLASYAFVEAELTKAIGDTPAGSKSVGVPDHSGRLWINYTFDPGMLEGWSVGAGIYAAAGAPVNLPDPVLSATQLVPVPVFKTDAFFTVDAKIAYDTENYSASFNVKNLTGEEYFLPYSYFGGRVAPGDDRAYYGSIVYKY